MALCVEQVQLNEGARTATFRVSTHYPEGCYFEYRGGLMGVSEQLARRNGSGLVHYYCPDAEPSVTVFTPYHFSGLVESWGTKFLFLRSYLYLSDF